MIYEIKTISVVDAQNLLSCHVNLRPIDDVMVAEMKSDLENGTFNKEDANICLKPDGTLYYGQHILTAIVSYGNPVELNVYTCESDIEYHNTPAGRLNKNSKYKYVSARRRELLKKKAEKNENGDSESAFQRFARFHRERVEKHGIHREHAPERHKHEHKNNKQQ